MMGITCRTVELTTYLFTKMIESKEKKEKNTYIQKYTMNKNGSRNRNKE